ncbi:MAG: MBL fold metallo-hydrolase [Lentisphaerae bacterium]|nr:MBL fold metallo-hydrolase [Lentisphaerota bacterium]
MNIQARVTGFIEENCFFVTHPGTRETVVIDPGDNASELAAFLQEQQAIVVAYLLTHGHVDHLTDLAELSAAFPAPVHLHPLDAAWCFSKHNDLPGFYPAPAKPACPLVHVREGDVLELAGAHWRVIETPGHTPGGICWKLDAPAVLFTGDTLFRGSAGRTDLPGGDPRALASSLRKLAALPDDLAVYPGHGEPSTIGHEKKTNWFLRRH